MDNIISDLESLYEYISSELNKRNIILLNQSSLTTVDNENINRMNNKNIKGIRNWIRGLRLTEKEQLIKMIKSTKKNYDIKRKALLRDITFRKWYLWILLIVLIIAIVIILLFKVVMYVDTAPRDREPWENFVTFLIILIDVLILLVKALKTQIKKENEKTNKVKLLNNNITKAFNTIDVDKLKPTNLVDKLGGLVDNTEDDVIHTAQIGSIITFMKEYETQIAKLKFGDFIKFTLIDQISYFFSEQKDLVYKKTTESISNSKLFDEFVEMLFDKDIILQQITQINQNFIAYSIPIIPDQDIIVNDFFKILHSNRLINEDSIQKNQIYIIIKRQLLNLIKYYQVRSDQVLNKIKVKVGQLKKTTLKDIDTDIVLDNYTKIINLLYINIEEEAKKDSYMSAIKEIPPRFTKVGNFIDFYKKLSITHLESIRASASDTIIKINKLLSDYKIETEKEFNDSKNSTYQLGVIGISIIIISAIHLKKYIWKDEEKITKSKDSKTDLPVDVHRFMKTIEESGNYIMNGINIYSIWFFFSVTILSYWYKKKLNNKLNFSEYSNNTTNIVTKLTEVISKIDDLIILRNYIADKSVYNYQLLTQTNDDDTSSTNDRKSLLDKFGYKFVSVDETNEVKNIIKLGSDNIYYLWTLDKVESEMCSLIYHDYVIIMQNYECCNFINIKAEVPFPITEVILDGVFLSVTIIVFFLILQRLNPLKLLDDLNHLRSCSEDKIIIIENLEYKVNDIKAKIKAQNTVTLTEEERKNRLANIDAASSLEVELAEAKEKYKDNKLSKKCEDILLEYGGDDISRAKTFMTISIFYTTMYLSFKIISSSYTV